MPLRKLKFTKTWLKTIDATGGRVEYHDTVTPGLSLRVSPSRVSDDGEDKASTKTFVVRKRAGGAGNPKRVTLGRFPELGLEQARSEAARILGEFAQGRDPAAKKKAQRTRKITLGNVLADYIDSHPLKPRTVTDYLAVTKWAYPDWLTRPITDITKDMVETRHKVAGRRSEARSNNAMRVLRAVIGYAMDRYEDDTGKALITKNPVDVLKKTFYKIERRQHTITPDQLPRWFSAVSELPALWRDYLKLILLTGLRRGEASRLQWCDIDLTAQTLTVRDTKNREPHTLPLSDYLLSILADRHKDATSDWVFPSETSKSGHIETPGKRVIQVREKSSVFFSLHDLRRTFITTAESLDIPYYALKQLANHKLPKNDVTAGYVAITTNRLREPMQRITDFLLKAGGVTPTATITKLVVKDAATGTGTGAE